METVAVIFVAIYIVLLIADVASSTKLRKAKEEYNDLQRERIKQLEADRKIFIKVAKLNCNIWNALAEKKEDHAETD